jgi:putative ABC transport system permease protein
MQSAKIDVQAALNEGGRSGAGGGRQGLLRRALVVVEVAAALILLACAGLMVRSFTKLKQTDVGFTAQNVLTMSISLPDAKYLHSATPTLKRVPAGLQFFDQLLDRLNALPGVKAATAATQFPLDAGSGWGRFMSIEGRPTPPALDQVPIVRFAQVSPDYFKTLGITLRTGRSFTPRDDESSQLVAIINESAAKEFFPGEDPVGKTIWMGPPDSLIPEAQRSNQIPNRRLIVGVAADVKGGALNKPASSFVYAPLHQFRPEGYATSLMVAVQTEQAGDATAAAVRAQVQALEPEQPVAQVRGMNELLDKALSASRFSLLLLGSFAIVGLVLAAIGVYGVMAFAVSHRTHEIGIRMALGAQGGNVLRMVLWQGMVLVAIGVLIGSAGAWAFTRLMADLLYGVTATDPLTFASIAVLLTAIAFIACWIPARRATKVDPIIALRYE